MVPKDNKHLQVYAGIANRIGLLSEQYERISKGLQENQKYEVTLHLCLLQTLLTNVVEQLDNEFGLGEWDDSYFRRPLRDKSASKKIGLCSKMITSSWDKGITILEVLRYMRNSLSHPTKTLPSTRPHPSTGYTVNEGEDGTIKSIELVVGRHNKDNDFRRFYSKDKAEQYIEDNRLNDVSVASSDVPPCYYLVKNGKIFAPTYRMKMKYSDLILLVRKLSLLLSQPLLENWPKAEFNENLISSLLEHQITKLTLGV
jgi:hypothetical protein